MATLTVGTPKETSCNSVPKDLNDEIIEALECQFSPGRAAFGHVLNFLPAPGGLSVHVSGDMHLATPPTFWTFLRCDPGARREYMRRLHVAMGDYYG